MKLLSFACLKDDLLVTDEFTSYQEGVYCTVCHNPSCVFVAFFMLHTYGTVYITCIYLLETDKYNFLEKKNEFEFSCFLDVKIFSAVDLILTGLCSGMFLSVLGLFFFKSQFKLYNH